MNTTHTPGPWRIDYNGEDPEFAAPRIKGNSVENVAFIPAYEHPRAEMDANARLIAAAPELLEALRALLSDYEGTLESLNDYRVGSEGHSAIPEDASSVAARAAIAKATQFQP